MQQMSYTNYKKILTRDHLFLFGFTLIIILIHWHIFMQLSSTSPAPQSSLKNQDSEKSASHYQQHHHFRPQNATRKIPMELIKQKIQNKQLSDQEALYYEHIKTN